MTDPTLREALAPPRVFGIEGKASQNGELYEFAISDALNVCLIRHRGVRVSGWIASIGAASLGVHASPKEGSAALERELLKIRDAIMKAEALKGDG